MRKRLVVAVMLTLALTACTKTRTVYVPVPTVGTHSPAPVYAPPAQPTSQSTFNAYLAWRTAESQLRYNCTLSGGVWSAGSAPPLSDPSSWVHGTCRSF